jgi:hypothetical protein
MSSFDPMAAAIDWLDAYRAASFSIIDMYASDGAIECACDGSKTIYGRAAMTEYWRHRFDEKRAGELIDLRSDRDIIIVAYAVPGDVVQAILVTQKPRPSRHSAAIAEKQTLTNTMNIVI